MFELYHPPLPGQIMRFTAWRVQNDYFRWCGQVQARTKNRLIFSHESALGLMGVGFLDTAAVKPDRVYEGHSSEGRAFKNRISGNRASKYRVSENRLSDLRTYEDHIAEPDVSKDRADFPLQHVLVPPGQTRVNLQGVRCHRLSQSLSRQTISVGEFRCSSPEAAFCQLASTCFLGDLVVLGDSLICRDEGLAKTSLDALTEFVDSCGRFAGRRKCGQALRLMRSGVDSPRESLLRLWMLRYGLPEPCVNFRMEDPTGRVYYLDLAYPQWRIGVEYNGKHHHEQWFEDWNRFNSLQSHGWQVFIAEKEMIDNPVWRTSFMMQVMSALSVAGAESTGFLSSPMTVAQIADGRTRLWKDEKRRRLGMESGTQGR
ncbi:hypothetical protein A200_05862 [Parascardovia denticolens IPLA 20019]|uniref:hypothetical protein n=1 Tax=Parascardovia denticolens TaxID=78258 RepID=UPI000266B505|nr:hypothetical protein [Parascardovia denticolens]EIT88078.1 hypothetical protein A200_05862 [Parascardovia denticolens IPLA 20019]